MEKEPYENHDTETLKFEDHPEAIRDAYTKYEKRVTEYNSRMTPETMHKEPRYWDAVCKMEIAWALIENGRVSKNEILQKLVKQFSDHQFGEDFEAAWYVILDYAKTGGKNLSQQKI